MKNKTIGMFSSSVFLIAMAMIVPVYMLFFKAEISNEETRFLFFIFSMLFLSGLLICVLGWLAFRFIRNNNKFGDSFGFYGIGDNPSSPIWKKWTHPKLYLASLIVFGTLFLIANKLRLGAGTESRFLPQQFSKFDNLIFSTLQVPVAENIFWMGTLFILTLALTFLAVKYKISKQEYKTYIYVVFMLIGGGLAWILHQTAYQNSDIAGMVVFSFWAIMGFLTINTGSPYPALAMHQMNNFMITYSSLYSSDSAFFTMIFILIGLSVAFALIYWKNLFKSGKKKEVLK